MQESRKQADEVLQKAKAEFSRVEEDAEVLQRHRKEVLGIHRKFRVLHV